MFEMSSSSAVEAVDFFLDMELFILPPPPEESMGGDPGEDMLVDPMDNGDITPK